MENYIALLTLFVNKVITADEYETLYLRLYKSTNITEYSDLLDELFCDVDAYNSDYDNFDEEHDITATQLHHRATTALHQLLRQQNRLLD